MFIFRWQKTADKRKVLMETYDIRAKRIKYLRQLQRYIEEKRPIIYTDESYIHSSHTQPKEWSDGSLLGLKAPISKGNRLIMVHAGGKMGFISNALLLFRSGTYFFITIYIFIFLNNSSIFLLAHIHN